MKKMFLTTVFTALFFGSTAFCEPDYYALDYVTLGNYKGLEVTLTKIEASEEEIEEQIKENIKSSGKLETIYEGAVEEGDIAVINFEGKIDGKAFDGGTSKDYELEIGSDTFIDGFEDGLIGVSIGETVDLSLAFPETYSNSELAGQDVVFTVTINEIRRVPELTDELAEELNKECNTVDAYQEYVKESILANKQENQHQQMLNDLYIQIHKNSTIESYPEDIVNSQVESMKEYYEDQVKESGMSFKDYLSEYLSMTEEEFEVQATSIVQSNMDQELLLNAIAEQEGLEVDDSYFEKNIDTYVEMTNAGSKETLLDAYGEDTLRQAMLMDMVMDFVIDSCVITNPEDQVIETEAPDSSTESDKDDFGKWVVRKYTDEFGNPTENEYITYGSTINGTFSNSATTNSELIVKLFIDDRIAIQLFEYGDNLVKSYGEHRYNISMLDSSGNKISMVGTMHENGNRIFVSVSGRDSIIEAFNEGGEISFYIEDADRTINNYLFTIPDVNGFSNAYESLNISE